MSDSATNNDGIGTPLASDSEKTRTISGEITHHVHGVVIDANNLIVIKLDSGESITVLVMEAGMGRALMGADSVCDKNPQANEVFNTLKVGDQVTVHGKVTDADKIEVCSSDRFWIKKT